MINIADFDEQPDAAWHIDAKDDDPRDELMRQTALLRKLKLLAPGVTAWAVPNAAKRTQWAAAKAKREGMVSGVPDLTITWNRGVAFVEMKAGRAMPTPAQRDMLNTLYRAGHHCGVFRQETSVIKWLASLGAPMLVSK